MTRLRLGADLELHTPIEGRHLELAPERGGGEADGHLAIKIVLLARKDGVFLHLHVDVLIARRTAVFPSLALAREANAIAVVDTGRDLHLHGLENLHTTLTMAGTARGAGRAAAPGTARTGRRQ